MRLKIRRSLRCVLLILFIGFQLSLPSKLALKAVWLSLYVPKDETVSQMHPYDFVTPGFGTLSDEPALKASSI